MNPNVLYVQLKLSGLNSLRIMKICSRYDLFKPLRVNHSARSGSKWRYFWGNLFQLLNDGRLSVLIRIASHNIQYHNEAKTFPKMFVFSSNEKNFVGT